jgi:hypothetical protein
MGGQSGGERQRLSLLVHYLIRWPVYRKSKALGTSERNYYYRLAWGLERLEERVEIFEKVRSLAMCSVK